MWDFESLWAKARLYAARAEEHERDGPLFPFWSFLALELLGRAVLASVHPALLADPRDGHNVMYAFGFGQPKAPKSVPVATVFRRCGQVVLNFTDEDIKTATALMQMRNEELHSGGTPLEGLGTRAWLVDFYRLCQILLKHVEKDLVDMFDQPTAAAAVRLMDAANEKTLAEVQGSIKHCRSRWRRMSDSDQVAAKAKAATMCNLVAEGSARIRDRSGKQIQCPACDIPGWLTGEVVRTSAPRVGDDAILISQTMLPTAFLCFACELRLAGEGTLHAAEMDDQFTVEIEEDPASFYGIETADDAYASDYDDYGNE